jgi:hypothetical protein
MKLHIHTYFFVTHLDGHLAFGKRNNNYFYIPDEKTYKKHFRKDWKLMEFVITELGPRIRLNNKKIQENPNRYGEIISWHNLVDNDFLTDYEQIQLRRHGEICDPTPCMFN